MSPGRARRNASLSAIPFVPVAINLGEGADKDGTAKNRRSVTHRTYNSARNSWLDSWD
jgi:hypothetical protein